MNKPRGVSSGFVLLSIPAETCPRHGLVLFFSMMKQKKHLPSVLVKPAGPDCNMECEYCFYLEKSALFPRSKKHRMNEEILREMTRQVMSQEIRHVSFGWQGGEPTLMGLPFFEKAVEYQQYFGRGQTVANGLQTNGIVLDRRWADFLREFRFLVGLSLDGPEHVHNRYRPLAGGRGSWSRVADRAKLLLDNGVTVNALIVLNDYSVQHTEEIYAFHSSLGLTHMQFIPCVETDPRDPSRKAPFSVSPEAYGKALCTLFDAWRSDFSDDGPATSLRFFESVFFSYVDMVPPECTLLAECGDYVVVEHNGDVFSCDFFVEPEHRLGNIMTSDVVDMVNSAPQTAFGREKARLPQECRQCTWLVHCRGGCPKYRTAATTTENIHYLCESFKMFFSHADEPLTELAEKWKRERRRRVAARQEPLYPPSTEKERKTGRNDPCPCGSGKKYKYCCGHAS